MSNDYPKALYKNGDVNTDPVLVEDDEQEAAQRKAGYIGGHEKPKAEKGAK